MDILEEKKLLLKIIKVLNCLDSEVITVEEAENIIFKPRYSRLLEEKHCNCLIIDIINEGCLLEDYESLIPDKLNEKINSLINMAEELLKNYK